MNVIDKLKKDLIENEGSPLFAPYDDDKLGKRFPGRFERIGVDNGEDYKRFFFDNGNNYTFILNERKLYECKPIPADYYIHKHIEKAIYDIVTNNSNENLPLILCQENEVISKENPVVLIRTIINRESRNVYVPNLLVQIEKRYQGYGKQLLREIYAICKNFGYRLFLTEMVESFYNRMVRRGARIIEVGNVVEITDDTSLTSSKK